MTNISLNLSNKLLTQTTETLRRIKTIADELEIPLLLVGATARDLILKHYELQPYRETKDIDFGIAIGNWSEFAKLKAVLNEKGKFTIDGKAEHRLKDSITETPIDLIPFKDSITETPINLIPFGEIESPRGKITWKNKMEMITSGFAEAFESALNVKLSDDLVFNVVSPVGLALLKLVAWTDRHSNKDSQDFWLIVKNYLDLGNEERLYSELLHLLEDDNFARIDAGARLLGRDLSKILTEQTEEIILSIFADEKKLQKLASEIYRMEGSFDDDKFNKILAVLESFQKGLSD